MEKKKNNEINAINLQIQQLKKLSNVLTNIEGNKQSLKYDILSQLSFIKSLMKKPQDEIIKNKKEILEILKKENQKQKEKYPLSKKLFNQSKSSQNTYEQKIEEELIPLENELESKRSDNFILSNSSLEKENIKQRLKNYLNLIKKEYFFVEKEKEIYIDNPDKLFNYLENMSVKNQQWVLNLSRSYNKQKNLLFAKIKRKKELQALLKEKNNEDGSKTFYLTTSHNNNNNNLSGTGIEELVKKKRNSFSNIKLSPKEELFQISEDEFENDEILQEEFFDDYGINFEDKVLPPKTIDAIWKEDEDKKVPELNLKLIEYNKKKFKDKGEGDSRFEDYSIQRRILIKKKMIKAIKKKIIKNKEKIQHFLALISKIKESIKEFKKQRTCSMVFDVDLMFDDSDKKEKEVIIDDKPVFEDQPINDEKLITDAGLYYENKNIKEFKRRNKGLTNEDLNKSF